MNKVPLVFLQISLLKMGMMMDRLKVQAQLVLIFDIIAAAVSFFLAFGIIGLFVVHIIYGFLAVIWWYRGFGRTIAGSVKLGLIAHLLCCLGMLACIIVVIMADVDLSSNDDDSSADELLDGFYALCGLAAVANVIWYAVLWSPDGKAILKIATPVPAGRVVILVPVGSQYGQLPDGAVQYTQLPNGMPQYVQMPAGNGPLYPQGPAGTQYPQRPAGTQYARLPEADVPGKFPLV
jgi:hypothetical protein